MEIRHIIESWTLQFGIWFEYVQCKIYIYQIIIIIIWLWSMGISNNPTTEVIRIRDRTYEIELLSFSMSSKKKMTLSFWFDWCNMCKQFNFYVHYFCYLAFDIGSFRDVFQHMYMKCTKSGLSCLFFFLLESLSIYNCIWSPFIESEHFSVELIPNMKFLFLFFPLLHFIHEIKFFLFL